MLTVATVSPWRIPHAALVVAACVEGAIVFTATPHTVLHHKLERSPLVAVTCSRGASHLMGQGRAVLLGRYDHLPDLHAHFGERLEGYEGMIFEFNPTRLFATCR